MGYIVSAIGGTGTGLIANGVSTTEIRGVRKLSKTDRATYVDIESIDDQYDGRFLDTGGSTTAGDFY